MESSSDGGGGWGPPIATLDMKPDFWSESVRESRRVVDGTEVRPRRAREAFWRCEQACESVTRDMFFFFSSSLFFSFVFG